MNTLIDESQAVHIERAARREVWRWSVVATGFAIAVNVVLHAVSGAAGVDHVVVVQEGAAPITVTVLRVVMTTAGAMVVGLGLTLLARRRWRHGLRVMQIVGGLFALVSVVMPLGVPEATAATRLTLAAMHLVAGAAFVAALAKLRRT